MPESVDALQFYIDSVGQLCAFEVGTQQTFLIGAPARTPPWIGDHGARVHCVTANLNPLVNQTFIQFDTVDWDTEGFAAGSLPTAQLVIPPGQSGLYQLHGQANPSSSANGASQGIIIAINGTTYIAKSAVQEQGTSGCSLNVSALWRLAEGDRVQLLYSDTASKPSSYLNIVSPGTPSLALARVA